MKKSDRNRTRKEEGTTQARLPLGAMLQEALLDTVISSGMAHVREVLEQEREAVCGPRYRHDPRREASRAGSVRSSLVLGGRRVAVPRPRARTAGGHEVALPSWRAWSDEDPLRERAVEQMVLGVSTRRYERSLEPLPEALEGHGASRSAVSRRFVHGTKRKLAELMHRDLSGLDLVALLIDGINFADHVILTAVGIDAAGEKHVLGLQEGATENATACKSLLANLVDRGLRTDRAILVVIDGSKALFKAIRHVFGPRALVQRCQEHKKRNVTDHLPEAMRLSVRQAMTQAYRSRNPARARRLLDNLARRLASSHPGAAASLREGLDETLTVMRLGLPEWLERTLSTTNLIENLLSRVRENARRVTRWTSGTMVLRWSAAGVLEAQKGFRRLRGHAGMPRLVSRLRAHDAQLGGDVDTTREVA